MHAVARIAYGELIPNIQASWVKLGAAGARQLLQAGVNDLGGTLMDENISRAAGATHGQGMDEDGFHAIVEPLGRPLAQRTTLYGRVEERRARYGLSCGHQVLFTLRRRPPTTRPSSRPAGRSSTGAGASSGCAWPAPAPTCARSRRSCPRSGGSERSWRANPASNERSRRVPHPLPHRRRRPRPAAARPARRGRRRRPTATSSSRSSSPACAWPATAPTASTSRSPTPPSRRCAAAFRAFAPYRDRRKATIFGSARTVLDHPAYVQARDLAARLAAARLDGRDRRRPRDHVRRARGRRARPQLRREHPAAVRAGAEPLHRRRPASSSR